MTKELKDYMPFYLGCECVSDSMFSGVLQLRSVGLYGFHASNDETTVHGSHEHIKLLLRPLSDISHKEVANLLSVYDTAIENANYRSPIFQIQYRDKNNEQQYKHAYLTQLSPDQFLYLIKQGFDLFGLIEAGLAISKPKMQ